MKINADFGQREVTTPIRASVQIKNFSEDEISLIELYRKGAVEAVTFSSWREFTTWMDGLDETGVQISLKLPCLVYAAVRGQEPSMQNFIVESIKTALKSAAE